ncbi:hypothetical protein Q9L58_004079 [Maublancomyces gigas]|uniref:Uncharacterized protein n=1 Tax=Discina gigas TaxID=1032678 RepID=A0ABR3GM39_9PEZI
MLSVIVSEMTLDHHNSFEIKFPVVVGTVRTDEEMDMGFKVRRMVRRYLKQIRASGRDPCAHRDLLPGAEWEDKVIAITAMCPPTTVEFSKETSVSVDAVMIPLCTGCENYAGPGHLY